MTPNQPKPRPDDLTTPTIGGVEWHRLVIGVHPQMYERLRLDAFVKRISIAEICREALERYYEDKEGKR